MKTSCECSDTHGCQWTEPDLTCLEEPTTTPVPTTNDPKATTTAADEFCEALEDPNGYWECTDGNAHDTKESSIKFYK